MARANLLILALGALVCHKEAVIVRRGRRKHMRMNDTTYKSQALFQNPLERQVPQLQMQQKPGPHILPRHPIEVQVVARSSSSSLNCPFNQIFNQCVST